MNLLRTTTLALLTVVASTQASPIYDLRNLYESELTALEGWGLKVENLFGHGIVRDLGFNDPGGAQLFVMPGTGEAHMLAQLSGAGGSTAGIYTLNLMFSGMTVGAGGTSLEAGFSIGGPHVLGTLTTPDGEVFHMATADGSGPSFTLTEQGGGVQGNGSLRFCTDASCDSLLDGALGTLALGASCAAGSDCSGLPGAGGAGGPGGAGDAGGNSSPQTFSLALPPESPDASEVPEPGTYITLGFGLVGLSLIKRRSR